MITSAEEFYRLRKSDDPIEYTRASNDEISYQTCIDVIGKFPDMKKWIVHNKKVPLEILKLLVNDSDDDIRFSIAMKRKIDESMFKKLSEDSNYSIRLAIARNAKVPINILRYLTNDIEPEIARVARQILSERNKIKGA